MILNELQGVTPISQPAIDILEITPKENTEASTSVFVDLIRHLDANIKASDNTMNSYILNQNISTHELMISMENAKHSLQMAVEVRNKIIESFEKITQMGI